MLLLKTEDEMAYCEQISYVDSAPDAVYIGVNLRNYAVNIAAI
jgi:hypothetical protein